MANKNEISIRLIVNDDGSVAIKQFGKTTEEAMGKASAAAGKTTGTFDKLKGSYLELSAKAVSAYLAVSQAMEYMEMGAKATQAEDSFRRLVAASGESADRMIANMKRATAGAIDDSQMMQKSVKAMMLDFNGEQIEQMAAMARMAARVSGEDVGTAFDNIVNALSTNMPRALKQYGLITKEQISLVNQALADGVEDINLYGIAMENMMAQTAKMGPLEDNAAEALQRKKAQWEDLKETLGIFLMDAGVPMLEWLARVADSIAHATPAPLLAGFKELWNDTPEAPKAPSPSGANQSAGVMEANLRAAQAAMAQKKVEVETLKALNKSYFADQEAHIKNTLELMRQAGGDEYAITKESFDKRGELMAAYYDRAREEMQKEAQVRSKADRDKLADAAFVAEKMKALDADVAGRAHQLAREKTLFAIQTAQNDVKNLTSRLGDYQQYYDALKAQMDKNTEDERKHLEELKSLRAQRVAIDASTTDLIARIKGADPSVSVRDRYESARSTLSSQYGSALDLTGQERIKALEDYKQAVAALQQQFAQGIPGIKDIFGKTDEVISAKTVAEDAISDIERAAQMQRNALRQLEEEKQSQIDADRQWGQVLQEEAVRVQGEMERLKNIIADMSQQIINMQTSITLTGEDQVTSVVDGIISKIEQLHALAARPITLTAVMDGGMSSGSGISEGFTNIPFTLGSGAPLDSYATGTPYVPRTGLYQLHQGEAVVPAEQNKSNRGGVNITGDIIINVPASAAADRPEDWRMITRQYIVPELRKLNS